MQFWLDYDLCWNFLDDARKHQAEAVAKKASMDKEIAEVTQQNQEARTQLANTQAKVYSCICKYINFLL